MSVSYEFILPPVDKGIPIPPAKIPRKKRVNPPSPWVAYLLSLQVGDSFKVPTYSTANIHNIAKKLGIGIVIKREGKMVDRNDYFFQKYGEERQFGASRVYITSQWNSAN